MNGSDLRRARRTGAPASSGWLEPSVTSPGRFAPILYVIGILLVGLGGIMLIPALVDLDVADPDWRSFIAAGITTVFFGGSLVLATRGDEFRLDLSQGFLLTTLAWLAVVSAGALPFMFGEPKLSFTNAFFESMSGFTTTGSTVIVGLDRLPPGILLWRSLTNWIGGLGIVVMAIIMLPFLRVGGMQLFRTESSERSDKIFPRAVEMGRWISSTYLLLTLLCTIALKLAGMSWFDASNHAMATLATGGFSTKDASIGFYHSPTIEWVEVLFMTSGALPLTFYVRAALQGPRSMLEDAQVWVFLAVLGTAILAMTVWVWLHVGTPASEALRMAAFNVTSVVTDTGFTSADFSQWGSFAIGAFFLFYFIGGCAGSTAGSIKIFRWRIIFSSVRSQFHSMRRPHEVMAATYSGRRLTPELMASVVNFFFLYILTFAVLSTAMMLFGVDFLSSVSGVAQAMANAGPGLGPIIGPAGNFAALPDPAKWIVSFAMLLGRLELFTMLVLLTPSFWR
jgi:trk/ktr system potassium uptake protein